MGQLQKTHKSALPLTTDRKLFSRGKKYKILRVPIPESTARIVDLKDVSNERKRI
jgi:hypothetical protein